MSTVIDGFLVLQAVGQHPELFSSVAVDARKAALTIAKKFLKGKSIGLEELKSFYGAVEAQSFGLVLESLNDNEIRTLTKKIDKYYLADEKPAGLRSHLRALASSQADLSPKPAPAPRKASSSSSKTAKNVPTKSKVGAEWPQSMSARPSRR